jgi:hypothetical protein
MNKEKRHGESKSRRPHTARHPFYSAQNRDELPHELLDLVCTRRNQAITLTTPVNEFNGHVSPQLRLRKSARVFLWSEVSLRTPQKLRVACSCSTNAKNLEPLSFNGGKFLLRPLPETTCLMTLGNDQMSGTFHWGSSYLNYVMTR